MRSTHCRGNAFDLHAYTHARTHSQSQECAYLSRFRLWRPACSTRHRRCDPAGQVTRRLQASQMPAHNWILRILWCLRVKSNSFQSEAVHITPNHWKSELGVTTVWYTSAPNRKICKDLICRKSGHCSNQRECFSLSLSLPSLQENTLHFVLLASNRRYFFESALSAKLFILGTRPLGESPM